MCTRPSFRRRSAQGPALRALGAGAVHAWGKPPQHHLSPAQVIHYQGTSHCLWNSHHCALTHFTRVRRENWDFESGSRARILSKTLPTDSSQKGRGWCGNQSLCGLRGPILSRLRNWIDVYIRCEKEVASSKPRSEDLGYRCGTSRCSACGRFGLIAKGVLAMGAWMGACSSLAMEDSSELCGYSSCEW